MARAVEHHLYALPDLLDRALSEAIVADPASFGAFEAAELHMRGLHPGERAQNLFRAEPATALITPVWERLARLRPALVPEALAAAARLGVGAGPGRRFVRVHRGLTGTWLAAERTRTAEYLRGIASDTTGRNAVRAEALEGLSVLPGAVDLLLPWLDEDDAWLRETVLVRLARTDRPERALGVLLEHVDEGTSSRAVVSVLGSCAQRARPHLEPAPCPARGRVRRPGLGLGRPGRQPPLGQGRGTGDGGLDHPPGAGHPWCGPPPSRRAAAPPR